MNNALKLQVIFEGGRGIKIESKSCINKRNKLCVNNFSKNVGKSNKSYIRKRCYIRKNSLVNSLV